jgi:hypothetical protein
MAEKRKRLKWGRWLLLALVVLYFAPVIPETTSAPRCWAIDSTATCGPEDDIHEWISPSAVVGSMTFNQFVTRARTYGVSYEIYRPDVAEQRVSQARFGLTLANISTFRSAVFERRLQRERAFLRQYAGEYEQASRMFESLTEDARFAWPGEPYTGVDFHFARLNAKLAGDMDRVYALTERGFEYESDESAENRVNWLLQSAGMARAAGDFEQADAYIARAEGMASEPHLEAAVLDARANLALARFENIGDPALAEAALADYEAADAAIGSPLFGENHIRALSHLARCEEASAAIESRLAALYTEEVDNYCYEPENGITFDVWRVQVQRCRLMRLGNRDSADEACAEIERMAARGCTDTDFGYDFMNLDEPLPQPLACFASGDDPDQGGAADEADRG